MIAYQIPTYSELAHKNIILIIGGGIAAYKSLDLIRRLKEQNCHLEVIVSKAAQKFITLFSASSLLGKTAHSELFSQDSSHDINHIALAQRADLLIFAPLTANRMAALAHGLADDLPGAVYLATKAISLFCPAMNPNMWQHQATQHNKKILEQRNGQFIGPAYGKMAEAGIEGVGRLSEIADIIAKAAQLLSPQRKSLENQHFIVTAGPTREFLDPIRYISNLSSGKQGYEIARALRHAGARVTLISGPSELSAPLGIERHLVTSAEEMLKAVTNALPADGAIFSAAVCDWHFSQRFKNKLKKTTSNDPISFSFGKTPDILAHIAQHKERPRLVIGFAAETENNIEYAKNKLISKGADAILYNNVSERETKEGRRINIMGGDYNEVTLFSKNEEIAWPFSDKAQIARYLVSYIIAKLS